MKKKLIALAVASVFAAPAVALAAAHTGGASTVTISGTIDMSVDSVKGATNGVTPTELNREMGVSSNASNIIFSGKEALGGGLNAVFQVQTFISMNGSGASTANTGALSNGVSYLGLTGGFGGLNVGTMDTPMKGLGRSVDLFGNRLGDARNLTAPGVAAGTGNLWDNRPSNTIEYTSPAMGGFTGKVAYSTNTNTSPATCAVLPCPTTLPTGAVATDSAQTLLGLSGVYANGPAMVGLAYEKHDDTRGTNAAAGKEDASAWRLVGSYSFGNTRVVGLYQSTKDSLNTAATEDNRKVWGLGVAQKMGSNTFKVQYYKADDFGTTTALTANGATMWALGMDHTMSKRTTAYVGYARTSNDIASKFSVSGAGHDDNSACLANKTCDGIQVGLVHKF